VRFPPPLIFAAGFAAGWLLDRWMPIPLPQGLRVVAVGWPVVTVGAWLAAWSVLTLARAGTTVRPDRPSTVLVAVGPFRFSRNPLYLSFVLLYAGTALLTNTVWALVVLPLVAWAIDRAVIAREERYLATAFGETYEDYRRGVPRWV
jgi:protein-S-isoprenylcysteine O-methyltransferase Ste14